MKANSVRSGPSSRPVVSPVEAETVVSPAEGETLWLIAPLVAQTHCPFASTARLVAAPPYEPGETVTDHVVRSLPDVIDFARRAEPDALDAFVYRFPVDVVGEDLPALGRLVNTVVKTLMRSDPSDPREVDRAAVLQPRWRMSFAGIDCFLPVFAPLYPSGHSRHTFGIPGQVFILIQSDSSFHRRLGRNPDRIRRMIRARFAQAGQPYDHRQLEAHKFVLPLTADDPPVRWYDMHA